MTNARYFINFFVNNTDDDVIQDFLWMDSCAIISDKVNKVRER